MVSGTLVNPGTVGEGAAMLILIMLAVSLGLVALPALGAGQAVGIKHPVLEYKIDPASAASYEKAVERVMAMDEEEMLSYVPDRPMRVFIQCPNCYGGGYSGVFSWNMERPDELKCNYCAMVFPNDKYPDDQVIEGTNSLGEPFSYRYYHEPKKNINMFFGAHIIMFKRGWILNQLNALAVAYHATGKPEYARRAALILDRIAQLYPHYPAMRQWITTFEFPAKQAPPWPREGGKWGRWMESEIPEQAIIKGYDLIYDSEELDKLSQVRGYDVREKIEKDFLKATWEYINTWDDFTDNIAPGYLLGAAQIGQVINEPHYVHWAYHWMLEILYGGCFYDGMWREAPSYHYQTLGGLERDFRELTGYSDPPGYLDAEYNERFDNLDPKKDNPFIARAVRAPAVLDFPNGNSSPIHDTWPNDGNSKPRIKTVSTITPGYGHASLGRGEGPHQMQAQLHFSGAYGHSHLDNLNLTLFAKGRELLCDVGYNHTQVRRWNSSTISHNLVAIDRRQQTGGGSDGDLLAYFPDANGAAMVEADGRRAYKEIEGLEQYRRMLVLVPVSAENAYVVDVFRVKGGSTHDWLVHGSGDDDMTAECNVKLTGKRQNMLEEGEEWVEPRDEQSSYNVWGCIRDVADGKANGMVETVFRYVDEPQKGVRIHLLAADPGSAAVPAPTQVYLGKSVAPRRAGSDTRKAFDYWMPQLVVRKTGQGPLDSVFVAVEEPFDGKTFLTAIEPVALTPPGAGAVALRVTHGDSVDTIISTLDEAPYPERKTASGVSMRGRLGIVRQRGEETLGAWLFQGEELGCKQWRISTETGGYAGEISAATRKAQGADSDAFITDAQLPLGDTLQGVWMIVTHGNGYTHGYEIERIEETGGKRAIVVSFDHGLKIDGNTTQEVFFPRRKIEGGNSFAIPLAATMVKAER